VTDYRVYFIDAEGHIRLALDIECDDDDEAMRIVKEHASIDRRELWRRDRLVGRFDPSAGTWRTAVWVKWRVAEAVCGSRRDVDRAALNMVLMRSAGAANHPCKFR
jgi:hypothetical protein